MKKKAQKKMKMARFFDRTASRVTHVVGSPVAAMVAFLLVVVWGATGPIFNYSNTWQLVINTGTTIITFLMVFIIQQSQNKDTAAVHLKLNELIASGERASNRLVDIEDLTEDELVVLKKYYVKLSKRAAEQKDLFSSHSMDEAEDNHKEKLNSGKKSRGV